MRHFEVYGPTNEVLVSDGDGLRVLRADEYADALRELVSGLQEACPFCGGEYD